jgi:hypothetical protein
MALPWLIGAGLIAAGAALYNAVKDKDDDSSSSDNSAQKAEKARKAQQKADRVNRRKEIIQSVRESFPQTLGNHKNVIKDDNLTVSLSDDLLFDHLKAIAMKNKTGSSSALAAAHIGVDGAVAAALAATGSYTTSKVILLSATSSDKDILNFIHQFNTNIAFSNAKKSKEDEISSLQKDVDKLHELLAIYSV